MDKRNGGTRLLLTDIFVSVRGPEQGPAGHRSAGDGGTVGQHKSPFLSMIKEEIYKCQKIEPATIVKKSLRAYISASQQSFAA